MVCNLRQSLFVVIYIAAVLAGCTGRDTGHVSVAGDTVYTQKAAMNIYAYQPELALRIIDSAVIVGNMSEWRANMNRARIYSSTQMYDQVDSLLGGPAGIRLDKARAIGERLLGDDSVKADPKRQLDVLEMLANTARLQSDTTGWIRRLCEFVGICRQMGASQETNALRTEAEIGAALCAMGQKAEGMAKLDSAIHQLDASFYRENDPGTFKDLDALIIALKRKIVQLGSHDQYAETVPLARLIIERLDDYEQHPDRYHDGTYREPNDSIKRADYIRFYRGQAQNYLTAAYASLGEHGSMLDAFQKIERSVREATAREHIARYNAMQKQMEAERQKDITARANIAVAFISIFAITAIAFAVVVSLKNREIKRKNRILAQQIAETMNIKERYWEEKLSRVPVPSPADPGDLNALTDEQLFQHISDIIVREQLFLNPMFERQIIIDRFQLSKERVGAIFSKGSDYSKLSNYILLLRLEYAAKLLINQTEKSIVQVASESGFKRHTYFSDRFRQYFGMSPSDFRKAQQENS